VTFSAPPRKHDRPNARANLPRQTLEIPLEEQIPEVEDLPPLPEHRIPYTMHMVTQMPHSEHLKDESRARQFLEHKFTHALGRFEDFIRHVEVRFLVQEHFRKDKAGKKVKAKVPITLSDEELDSMVEMTPEVGGPRMPAPYQLKVVVSLKNHKEIVYSNPEKNAQATLTECVDLTVEGLSQLLKEEKDKMIKKKRKGIDADVIGPDANFDDEDFAEASLQEQIERDEEEQQEERKKDAAMESIYEAVERNEGA